MSNVQIPFYRGSNSAIIWKFKDGNDEYMSVTGSTFLLTVYVRGAAVIRLDSAVDTHLVVNSAEKTLTWNRTLDESWLVPVGNLGQWEIERRIGSTQEYWGSARFLGIGGLNDD